MSPSCDGKSWGSDRPLLQRREGAWIETNWQGGDVNISWPQLIHTCAASDAERSLVLLLCDAHSLSPVRGFQAGLTRRRDGGWYTLT